MQLDPATQIPPQQSSAPRRSRSAWWTLPILSMGLAIVCCAIIVGQSEENRQISWQKHKLQMDLDHLKSQLDRNDEFLTRLGTDPNLAERLAQRQMKLVREGTAELDLGLRPGPEETSPFRLVAVPPLPKVKPYEPAPGMLNSMLASPRQRVYAYGIGAFMVAIGLMSGASFTSRKV